MTKAQITGKIVEKLGLDKNDVQATIDAFMDEVKTALIEGENVYLRGFGSFILKTRAEKIARNISLNTSITIPPYTIPVFKPSKFFISTVKESNKIESTVEEFDYDTID